MTRVKKSLKRSAPLSPTPSTSAAPPPPPGRTSANLVLDDHELHRLGTLTSFESWLARVRERRDVGVCFLLRSVEGVREAFNERYEALCLVDATASRGQRVHFAFHGGLVASVSSLLKARAGSGRTAPLLLSAYGAQLAPHAFPGTSEPVVEFRQGRVAMRALWDECGWCDVDEKSRTAAPAPAAVPAAAAGAAKRQRTGKERADEAVGSGSGSAEGSTSRASSGSSGSSGKKAKTPPAAAAPQGTPTYIVPRKSKAGAAAAPGSFLGPSGSRVLAGMQYPPLSMCVRNGQIVNVIAVVAWKREARFSGGGSGDPMLSLGLCDPSTPGKHFSVNIFSPSMLELPTPLAGNVLLLRKVFIQRLAGVQYKDRPDWALLTARNDALQTSPRLMQPISGAEEEAMREMAAWGAAHFNVLTSTRSRPQVTLDALQGSVFCDVTAEVVKTFTRHRGDSMPPELYITDYTFHAAFARANDFKLGDIGQEELEEQRRLHGESGGFVCGTSLWDQQVEALDFLSTGDIITISNLQPRVQPNSILQGRLGGRLTISLIRQDHYQDNQAVQNLLRRKEARRIARAAQETARMEAMLGDELDEEAEAAARELEEAHARRLADAQQREQRTKTESVPPSESPASSASSAPEPTPPDVKPIVCKVSPSQSETPPSPTPEQRQVMRPPSPPRQRAVARPAPAAPAPPAPVVRQRQPSVDDEEVAEQRDARTQCSVPESCTSTLAAMAAHHNRAPEEEATWRVRVRVVDCLPRDIDEWACAVCAQCDATLPREHNFCVACGDDDAQAVRFTFNFGLLVEDAEAAPVRPGAKRARLPIVVSGEQAAKFLCGMDPEQVRQRPDKLARLRRRLQPVLGSVLAEPPHGAAGGVKREPGEEPATAVPPRAMTIGVRVSSRGAGGRVKYRLVGTALEKE